MIGDVAVQPQTTEPAVRQIEVNNRVSPRKVEKAGHSPTLGGCAGLVGRYKRGESLSSELAAAWQCRHRPGDERLPPTSQSGTSVSFVTPTIGRYPP